MKQLCQIIISAAHIERTAHIYNICKKKWKTQACVDTFINFHESTILWAIRVKKYKKKWLTVKTSQIQSEESQRFSLNDIVFKEAWKVL